MYQILTLTYNIWVNVSLRGPGNGTRPCVLLLSEERQAPNCKRHPPRRERSGRRLLWPKTQTVTKADVSSCVSPRPSTTELRSTSFFESVRNKESSRAGVVMGRTGCVDPVRPKVRSSSSIPQHWRLLRDHLTGMITTTHKQRAKQSVLTGWLIDDCGEQKMPMPKRSRVKGAYSTPDAHTVECPKGKLFLPPKCPGVVGGSSSAGTRRERSRSRSARSWASIPGRTSLIVVTDA
jgi:hypothetical protein